MTEPGGGQRVADEVQGRIDAVLSRVGHNQLPRDPLMLAVSDATTRAPRVRRNRLTLGIGAAERRRADRSVALRAAESAGRALVVEEARAALRRALEADYGWAAVWAADGYPGDAATGPERAEELAALDDLVLAAAVDDLVAPSVVARLGGDGEALLWGAPDPQHSGESALAAAGIEAGGPVDPAATPRAALRLIAGVAGAILAPPVVYLSLEGERGPLVAVLGALASAVLCISFAVWPSVGRRLSGGR